MGSDQETYKPGLWSVEMDDYQVRNLKWALNEIMKHSPSQDREVFQLHTGDWVGELLCKLDEIPIPDAEPNGWSIKDEQNS